MPVVLMLIENRLGGPRPAEGQYLERCELDPDAPFVFSTTRDPRKAMRFPDAAKALEQWRGPFGGNPTLSIAASIEAAPGLEDEL